jgi:AraC-like DNA-binding protein
VAFLVRRDGFAELGYAIHLPLDSSTAPAYDAVMAAAADFLRERCGEDWSPSGMLDRVRHAVAKELLRDSDVAIPEIASALGYADSVSFTRAFKRWSATTPGAWRKSARVGARA